MTFSLLLFFPSSFFFFKAYTSRPPAGAQCKPAFFSLIISNRTMANPFHAVTIAPHPNTDGSGALMNVLIFLLLSTGLSLCPRLMGRVVG